MDQGACRPRLISHTKVIVRERAADQQCTGAVVATAITDDDARFEVPLSLGFYTVTTDAIPGQCFGVAVFGVEYHPLVLGACDD
jgi:hypothetical protein